MQPDFIPQATVNQSATNSAAATIAIKAAGGPAKVRVASPSSNPAMYLKFGSASDAATASDMPILPGEIETFIMTAAQTNASILSSSASSGTLYFTLGAEA